MIKKAVIPAAGFGTRLLPASKSQPKEMLPIVDTPTIQYVVEEAVDAGITDILMIIGKGKRAIEEHFDRNFELEMELEQKGKLEELDKIKRLSSLANIYFVWQKELNGLGDAIMYARDHVANEPFAVLLGDTLLSSSQPVTRQLIDVYNSRKGTTVVLEEVPMSKVHRYGVIDGENEGKGVFRINNLVEKPAIEDAPSNLAIAGRYVFTPEIFSFLEKTPTGKNNEIQLTDAMQMMVQEHDMYGLKFDGVRYDIGNKLDFLKTNVIFGLNSPDSDISGSFKEFIKEIASDL